MTDTIDINRLFVQIGATTVEADQYTLPDTRVFRDAWALSDSSTIVSVDMEAAREIWRQKIRLAREAPLAALDVEFMRLLESGESTQGVASQKQALRDATADPRIEAAQTPEELALVHPAGLTVV